MKQTEAIINQHNLVYTFFNLAGFTISNNIVIDSDTRQPITYNGKYIYYNPQSTTIIGHSMVQLDLTRNNKINETLFNYWCSKQHMFGRYVRFFNVFTSNVKTSQAAEVLMEIMELDDVTRKPIGESERISSDGMRANETIAFCYVIAKLNGDDLSDVLELDEEYKQYNGIPVGARRLC